MQKTTKRKTAEYTRGYINGVRDLALVIEHLVSTQQLIEIHVKFEQFLQEKVQKAKSANG